MHLRHRCKICKQYSWFWKKGLPVNNNIENTNVQRHFVVCFACKCFRLNVICKHNNRLGSFEVLISDEYLQSICILLMRTTFHCYVKKSWIYAQFKHNANPFLRW